MDMTLFWFTKIIKIKNIMQVIKGKDLLFAFKRSLDITIIDRVFRQIKGARIIFSQNYFFCLHL